LSPHLKAVLQALLVTFLWSTSWVLIKIGLDEIPALTFAGLRYALATACLLPLALSSRRVRGELRGLTIADWRRLLLLALVLYTLTQGAQFLALAYLPAQTTSLLLSVTPVVVALASIVLLAERPTPRQWCGVGLYLTGATIFLYPADLAGSQLIGIAIAAVGVLANAGAAVVGRSVNRRATLSPITVTVVSMGVGSLGLLGAGVTVQGLPPVSPYGWLIIAWLAVVNTAFAFTLWNLTQRTLSATESSVVNSTMLIQIAVLAWMFLGEPLGLKEVTGLTLATLGVMLVQVRGPVTAAARRRTGGRATPAAGAPSGE
jgi:drug/metabolite transporter (DMT)-like permease